VAEIVGDGRPWTVLMISLLSMPWIDADAEVGVAELPLDHHERHTFVSHLDRVGVPHLVRRETTPHASFNSRPM
jgi:hypothetical protein